MEWINPKDVVELIRSQVFRIRTGILLLPQKCLGREMDEAARLGVEPVDIRQRWLGTLPGTTRFSGLTPQKLSALLDVIAEEISNTDCVLIYNFDLLLSRLEYNNRRLVWQHVIHYMAHRSRAVLITMPEKASTCFPSDKDYALLEQEKRITRIQ